jgi:hypothetical protein
MGMAKNSKVPTETETLSWLDSEQNKISGQPSKQSACPQELNHMITYD